MSNLRETLLETGPHSVVALGGAALGLVVGVAASAVRLRRGGRTRLFGLLAAAAVLLLLATTGLVVAGIQNGRADVIGQFLRGTRDASKDHLANLGIRLQTAGLVFIGSLVLLSLAVFGLGLMSSVLAKATREKGQWIALVLSVSLLLPAGAAAAGILVYGFRISDAFIGVPGVDPSMRAAQLLRSIEGAYSVLNAARIGLFVTVGVAVVTAVIRSRRAPYRPVSLPQLAAAVLLFMCGLLAFSVTRGHAADGRPLPILPDVADASYASKVPRLSPCPPTAPAPVLEFARDYVRIDWSPVDPIEFRGKLETVRNNYSLLHDGRPMPFLIVVADRATPVDRIIPYLQRLNAGMEILVASATSHVVRSKTLGPIERYEYCGRTFRLTHVETATPLSRYQSWAELAVAAGGSPAILEVAPW